MKMKRPDLLILIAIWQFITALGAIGGILGIVFYAFPAMLGIWGDSFIRIFGLNVTPIIGGIPGLSIALLILVGYATIAILGGIGLLIGKEWGRIISIICNAINLPNFPAGTTVGILCIIYLSKAEVRNYFTYKKSN